MIDKVLLAPYYWTLRFRHFLYNKGIKKSSEAEVPTVSVGNITVGGTGKTPHTEMILNLLLSRPEYREKGVAVLSRGYGRKTRGFQQVTVDGSASLFGDEPLQIKKNFPGVTVAVSKNRNTGAEFLVHPERLAESRKGRRCLDKNLEPSGIIVLDDAFQYRALKPSVSVLLIDYNRPIFYDHLMPIGHLRDLKERSYAADIIIVSKCPGELDNWERSRWADSFDLSDFDPETCSGVNPEGKVQSLFFTRLDYRQMEPVFVDGENRYLYSKRLILFTGIADDSPLVRYLSDSFKMVRHFNFPDHHKFSKTDILQIYGAAKAQPTAVIATTDKDAQRIRDCRNLPKELRERIFKVPLGVEFLTPHEAEVFEKTLLKALDR